MKCARAAEFAREWENTGQDLAKAYMILTIGFFQTYELSKCPVEESA